MKTLTTLFVSAAFALGAQAQPAQPADAGVSTDPARAAAVERKADELRARNPVQSQVFARGQTDGGAAFVSGGNTVEDRLSIRSESERYNLWVSTVAKPSGAYLADARLRIVQVGDKSVKLERKMEGPWLLVDLPAGTYDVTATFRADGSDKDQTITNRVEVSKGGRRQVVLRFDSAAQVENPAANPPFEGNTFGAPVIRP